MVAVVTRRSSNASGGIGKQSVRLASVLAVVIFVLVMVVSPVSAAVRPLSDSGDKSDSRDLRRLDDDVSSSDDEASDSDNESESSDEESEGDPQDLARSTATLEENGDPIEKAIVFPVQGDHHFSNDWSDPHDDSGKRHLGIDIPAVKMTELVATTDAVVTKIVNSNEGAEGNMVILTDAEGWRYLYIHLNNDTPGTEDNANSPEYAFAEGLEVGTPVAAGELIGFVGDSGNSTGPHLHFAMTDPSGQYVNPFLNLAIADGVPTVAVLGDTATNGAAAQDSNNPTELALTGFNEIVLLWVAAALILVGVTVSTGARLVERKLQL